MFGLSPFPFVTVAIRRFVVVIVVIVATAADATKQNQMTKIVLHLEMRKETTRMKLIY